MIDLATWNLSVPVGSPPYTVETSKLVNGFKDQYFHSDTGTLFFWSPVTGSKTENAIYPRTELRETYSNGTCATGTTQMPTTCCARPFRSTRCPAPARLSLAKSTLMKASARWSSSNTSTRKKPRTATW